MQDYQGLFEPDHEAGGFVVTLPDFGYGATQGETEAEAMEMAQDLLALTIEDFMRESRRLPSPGKRRGAKFRVVRLPALQSAKVDLYHTFLSSGMSKTTLARRIGMPIPRVDRLFSLRTRSRIDEIEAALAILGKRLHLETRDAA